jgi:hypothetical protein
LNRYPKIALLYCGTRGGGLRFFEDLLNSKELIGNPYISKLPLVQIIGPQLTLAIPDSRILKFFRYKKRNFQRQVRSFVQSHEIDLVLFVMVSPYDYSIIQELRSIGVNTAFIFHDYKRHPGDYWPSSMLLHKIMNRVDIPIFLSAFVKEKANNPKESILVNFPKLKSQIVSNTEESFEFDYAILGRQKSYKGVKDYENVVRVLSQKYSGVIQVSKKIFGIRAEVLPSWLSDKDFISIIRRSRVIICLHREASQSGIVNLAHQLNRPVIVTEVGGIPEQVNSKNGVVVRDLMEIPFAMEKALNLNLDEIKPANQFLSVGELKSYLESYVLRNQ